AYQLTGNPLTKMCVSCRKSKMVTGRRIFASKSLRPSAVNSPLPEARRSFNPVIAGGSPLLVLSGLLVVRKLRGKELARFRSTSQTKPGESASAGGKGGFFCKRGREKSAVGAPVTANTKWNRRHI